MQARCTSIPVACRTAAEAQSDLVRMLIAGEVFTIEDRIGYGDAAWLRVGLEDGTCGYVAAGAGIKEMAVSGTAWFEPAPRNFRNYRDEAERDLLIGAALFVVGGLCLYSLAFSPYWPAGRYGREYLGMAYGGYRFCKGLLAYFG